MDESCPHLRQNHVLRDGQYMGTHRASETDLDQIISLMVGRKIDETARRVPKENPARSSSRSAI